MKKSLIFFGLVFLTVAAFGLVLLILPNKKSQANIEASVFTHEYLVDCVSSAFIIKNDSVTVIGAKESKIDIRVDGEYYRYLETYYAKVSINFANEALVAGLTKPGLDFSRQRIYVEKDGKMKVVKRLYVVGHGGIIDYRNLNELIYSKMLSPVEIDDLSPEIKARIKRCEVFIDY